MAQLAVAQSGAIQVDSGHRQHVPRQIDADGVLGVRGEMLQDAAGAGAHVEQVADVFARQQVEQDTLDFFLVHVERTDLVPARRVLPEIRCGLGRARLLDRRQALQVQVELRVVGG